jgi:hypothetical protein
MDEELKRLRGDVHRAMRAYRDYVRAHPHPRISLDDGTVGIIDPFGNYDCLFRLANDLQTSTCDAASKIETLEDE